MLLVDTNVLVDVLEDDPSLGGLVGASTSRIQSRVHELTINPVIFSEVVAPVRIRHGAVDRAIQTVWG